MICLLIETIDYSAETEGHASRGTASPFNNERLQEAIQVAYVHAFTGKILLFGSI